jgi:hypothetical protein
MSFLSKQAETHFISSKYWRMAAKDSLFGWGRVILLENQIKRKKASSDIIWGQALPCSVDSNSRAESFSLGNDGPPRYLRNLPRPDFDIIIDGESISWEPGLFQI